jgi:hypothetical protein
MVFTQSITIARPWYAGLAAAPTVNVKDIRMFAMQAYQAHTAQ